MAKPTLSVVVPVYNEAVGLESFNAELNDVLTGLNLTYEVIYVNDGSTDGSLDLVRLLGKSSNHIRVVSFSRNFGKEIATTAGIHLAKGKAVLMIDADGQHPVSAIPEFIKAWQDGAKVLVGSRKGRRASPTKRFGSWLFNAVFRRVTGIRLEADSSDFRLIDSEVQAQFNRLTEHNRITRGLIDWFGYERKSVAYQENPRAGGTSSYSIRKLTKLALDSAVSLSSYPLHFVAYIGAVVLPLSTILGLGMFINALLGDPLGLHATGGAYVMVLVLWLIGVLLVSQGIIGLYLAHIHAETQNRPLYVINSEE